MGDHGLGSLKDLGGGKWRYWPPMTGGVRPPSKTFRARTKREAQQWADQYRARVAAGEITGTKVNLAHLLDAWLDTHRGVIAASRLNYQHVIDKHLKPELGHLPIDKVTTYVIDNLYAHISPSAARESHKVLRLAFKQAIVWGWTHRNPVEGARPPKPRRTQNPPTVDQYQAILAAAPDDFRTYLQLAGATGARRSELCALRWGDVRLEPPASVTISHTLTRGPDGHYILGASTKTGKSRTVSIGADIAYALEQHRARYLGPPGGWVFTSPGRNTPWNPQSVSARFRALADSVGYPGRLHDVRHFNATQLIGDGVDIRTVSDRLGHSRPSTTPTRHEDHARPRLA